MSDLASSVAAWLLQIRYDPYLPRPVSKPQLLP